VQLLKDVYFLFIKMHVLTPEMESFLALHKYQLETSCIPKIFWEPLERKLREQIFDAGESFSLLKVDYEDRQRGPREQVWAVMVTADAGLSESDPNSVYLIDHAWTFRANSALVQLESNPQLVNRLANMMDVSEEDENNLAQKVYEEMWRYSQSYSVNAESAEDNVPIWYIMDEFGSGIQHDDEPNCRVVPFVHLPSQITYSILFPLSDLECGEVVTRDYIEGPEEDPDTRRALLYPWTPGVSFIDYPFTQVEPSEEFFSGGRIAENLPAQFPPEVAGSSILSEGPIKVYSEYSQVTEHLTHSNFVLTDNEDDADVLWYTTHFKDYASLAPHKRVNQFPYESVLTVKDLLCVVCRRQAPDVKFDPESLDTYPLWLPTTFNMKTELPQFVSYYERREAHGIDNHWICKPWNLARGLDTHISQNLNFLLRLPFSGPKIAQKYAENPVLFHRPGIGHVKFDIRYVILLRSVQPLTAYVYRQFFVRFANLPFQ
jgi:tubulin--tyrosine ligase-like protein 12